MLQGYADEVSMPVSKSLKSTKLSILPLMTDVNFTESEKALCSSLQLFFNMVHSYEKNSTRGSARGFSYMNVLSVTVMYKFLRVYKLEMEITHNSLYFEKYHFQPPKNRTYGNA